MRVRVQDGTRSGQGVFELADLLFDAAQFGVDLLDRVKDSFEAAHPLEPEAAAASAASFARRTGVGACVPVRHWEESFLWPGC